MYVPELHSVILKKYEPCVQKHSVGKIILKINIFYKYNNTIYKLKYILLFF